MENGIGERDERAQQTTLLQTNQLIRCYSIGRCVCLPQCYCRWTHGKHSE